MKMCEICGSPSEERICDLCSELLESVDQKTLNVFLHSMRKKRRDRPKKVEREMEDYEDFA
jgi:hypothetical protein